MPETPKPPERRRRPVNRGSVRSIPTEQPRNIHTNWAYGGEHGGAGHHQPPAPPSTPSQVQPPPPANPPAGVPPAKHNNQVPWWMVAGVIVIVIVLIAGTREWKIEQGKKISQETPEEIVLVRNVPLKVEIPDWDVEITPQKINTITHGRQLNLVIRTTDGKKRSKSEEVLIPSATNAVPGERKRLLEEARKTVERRVEALNAIAIPAVKWAVFVDSTSGDLEELRKQLQLQLSSDIVAETTKKGYSVKVYFHRLSATPSYAQNFVGMVNIPARAPTSAGQDEINGKRDEIAENLKYDKASAIVGGLLNAIYEDGLVTGDHVLVFSDGLECCRLFNWENGKPRDVAKANWDEIIEKMSSTVPNLPKLAGITVDWFIPAREEKADMIEATMKVWKEFFRRGEATFREHQ